MRRKGVLRSVILTAMVFVSILFSAAPLGADTGWMQKGVRVWYFGGIDLTDYQETPVSNAEEAYLIDAIAGGQVSVTHHSGVEYWSSAAPAALETYPLLGKGACWIHPQVLQELQSGDTWRGMEIVTIERKPYTVYTSLSNNFPYVMLPALAMFRLSPQLQRPLVKITYMIPHFSSGVAYFDTDTGLLLYYNAIWGINGKVYKMFFILSEINYDFGLRKAFAEDGGPHTGFKSILSEQSNTSVSSVVIQSMVETRYGNTIEMVVESSLIGAWGSIPLKIENYCFFGDVPIVRYKDHLQAPNLPPDQWDPYGHYLWWWLPPAALSGNNINVLGVPLTRTTTGADGGPEVPPLKAPDAAMFTATETPPTFHYSALWFGDDGYLTLFSAKDPSIGLDIQSDHIFANNNTLTGINYYRDQMGNAVPAVLTPALFLPLIKK